MIYVVLNNTHRGGWLSQAKTAVNRNVDHVTDGILRAEIRKIGERSRTVELAELDFSEKRDGIALVTINAPQTLRTLQLRRDDLDARFRGVIVGGILPTLMPKLVKKALPSANVFVGECEGSLSRLMDAVESGEVGKTFVQEGVVDITTNYTVPLRRNRIMPASLQGVELGRGCSYPCTFCSLHGPARRLRIRNPDEVIAELDGLGNRILFVDPNLSIYPPEYLERIFRYMERKGKFWWGEGTAKELIANPDIWDLMSRTNIAFLTGLEDLKHDELTNGKNGGQLLNPVRGSVIINSVIIGHPTQTMGDVADTFALFRRHDLTGYFHVYAPYPNTAAFRDMRKAGRIIENDLYKFDRRHVVVSTAMDPEKTFAEYLKIRTSVFTIRNTLREAWRVLKETKGVMLKALRLATLVAIRALIHFGAKKKRTEQGAEPQLLIE